MSRPSYRIVLQCLTFSFYSFWGFHVISRYIYIYMCAFVVFAVPLPFFKVLSMHACCAYCVHVVVIVPLARSFAVHGPPCAWASCIFQLGSCEGFCDLVWRFVVRAALYGGEFPLFERAVHSTLCCFSSSNMTLNSSAE